MGREKKEKTISQKIILTGIISIIISFVLLILSIEFYTTINELCFIKPDIYIYILIGFIALFEFIVSAAIVKRNEKETKKKRVFYEFFDTVRFIYNCLAIIMFIVLFLFTPANVNGTSMENTYFTNDRILVWHLFYEPKRNDVIIIDVNMDHNYYNKLEGSFYIKRIIAMPGDTCRIVEEEVATASGGTRTIKSLYINDSTTPVQTDLTDSQITFMFSEYYPYSYVDSQGETKTTTVSKCYYDSINKKCVVPEGFYICFGDNRNVSHDSRGIGMIHKEDIMGKSIFRIYPFKRLGVPKQNNAS